MKAKSILIFTALAVIFLFCVIGIFRWPYTEKLYVTLQASPYISAEFAGMSKTDKLLTIGSADMTDFEYRREGIYPIDYAPNYISLVVVSIGAGASFVALLSMLLDFYIARKRSTQKKQNCEVATHE